MFFFKSSAPAAADPDSEDESYEPRAYVVNAIQSSLLTSSEGGSHATPNIVSDDDSLPGLIDDSDDDSLPGLIDDSDSDPTMTQTLQSDLYVDAFHGNQESTLQTVPFKEFTLRAEPLLLVFWTITFQVHQLFARCSHWVLMRL